MTDLLRLIVEVFQFVWPLRLVRTWEIGVYLVFGRVWRIVGAGVYPVIPWFVDVHQVSMAWEPAHTGRKDITARDGRTIMYDAETMFRVVDAVKALTLLHSHEEGMVSLLSSVLSERLAEVDVERFEPERRGRLNTSLKQWVEREAAEYGLEVAWVRFTSFVAGPKTFRILNDQM